ncbi:MAG: hypothetical protein JXA97_01930 [Anaerolineales bacterium]|nr:hypothetical protein [Anaerolineales bacterium]
MKGTSLDEHPVCPECGTPLDIWPTLDGTGSVAVCPNCSRGPTPITPTASPPSAADPEPVRDSRLKDILHEASSQEASPSALEALLEDLDPEARELLKHQAPKASAPQPGGFREDFAQSLRYQGYTVQEDARGIRIGGSPRSSGPSSPYDIVRMAAELDGGLKQGAERVFCPKCEAVLPAGSTKCQWCGADIPPSDKTPPADNAA